MISLEETSIDDTEVGTADEVTSVNLAARRELVDCYLGIR